MDDTFYDKIKLLNNKSAYLVIPEKLSKLAGYIPGKTVRVTIEVINEDE